MEPSHEASKRLLLKIRDSEYPMVVPTLIQPEVAAVIGRSQANPERARAFVRHLQRLPNFVRVSLDPALARVAADTAAESRMRGSDAVCSAVARRFGSVLVSLDRQQGERVSPSVRSLGPEEALADLHPEESP